jgi:dTDP-4-dehydrorhamnose reductase
MKIMIAGARGLVGSHLASHFSRRNEVVALGHRDLDITDHAAVRRCCAARRPDLIINCAVLQVDECERDPRRAEAVNLRGPQSLAAAAAEDGAAVLHFSTNYVFEGDRPGRAPYTIADEPHPINVYGWTKLAGEHAVIEANARNYIARTAWVYGAGKESFLSTVARDLGMGRRVRAIVDAYSTTTYVADLVARIEEIIARGRHGTYHVVNEGVCSYAEFADQAARLIGLSAERAAELIERVSEAEMKRAAPRPRWTPLRCLLAEELGMRPLRDWRDALAAHLESTKGLENAERGI